MPAFVDKLRHGASRWVRSFGRRPADDAADAFGLRAAEPSADRPAAKPVPRGASRLGPGVELGGYRLERLIGRGAVGAVYLAVDRVNDTPVALKTLDLAREFEGIDFDAARERFLREAQAASRLNHPDIVTVYGAGEERGLAYIAMEPLTGSDLSRYTRSARLLPEPVVLRIVARVAEALASAHAQGVLHRDIKPANVMVDLAAHQVKLTDFGIARLTDGERTRTGLLIGTPSFMSPEQLAGSRLDGRSDLYSLGVMLFQLLTGRLPYDGHSMGELLRAIASEEPLDLRAVRSDLPDSLAKIVATALKKPTTERFADGASFASALGRAESELLGR